MIPEAEPATAVYRASPSLALIKYWGKQDRERNIPATSSLAVTLAGLNTVTRVRLTDGVDRVTLNGKSTEPARYAGFFAGLREATGVSQGFEADSSNDFPTGAGLASSSSGFAALAVACAAAADCELPSGVLSSLARVGSASAARAVYGGFVGLPAGSEEALELHPKDHWPEFRIVVVAIQKTEKPVSSREAMELTRGTSPYYEAWLADSRRLYGEALTALRDRDLEKLGRLMQLSYMRMFSTMLSADPPIHYWLPGSTAVIRECQSMRRDGIGAWETMDAGPQVKIACEAADAEIIVERIRGLDRTWDTLVSEPGDPPTPVGETPN